VNIGIWYWYWCLYGLTTGQGVNGIHRSVLFYWSLAGWLAGSPFFEELKQGVVRGICIMYILVF